MPTPAIRNVELADTASGGAEYGGGWIASVTRKISISLPDDVAAHLDSIANRSAYIAEAVRRRRRAERLGALMREHGQVTPDAAARLRARRAELADRRRARSTDDAA